jgi:hypothetical protein
VNAFRVALAAFPDRADRHVVTGPHGRYAELGRILTVLATDDLGAVSGALGDTDVAMEGVHAQPRPGGHALAERELALAFLRRRDGGHGECIYQQGKRETHGQLRDRS